MTFLLTRQYNSAQVPAVVSATASTLAVPRFGRVRLWLPSPLHLLIHLRLLLPPATHGVAAVDPLPM